MNNHLRRTEKKKKMKFYIETKRLYFCTQSHNYVIVCSHCIISIDNKTLVRTLILPTTTATAILLTPTASSSRRWHQQRSTSRPTVTINITYVKILQSTFKKEKNIAIFSTKELEKMSSLKWSFLYEEAKIVFFADKFFRPQSFCLSSSDLSAPNSSENLILIIVISLLRLLFNYLRSNYLSTVLSLIRENNRKRQIANELPLFSRCYWKLFFVRIFDHQWSRQLITIRVIHFFSRVPVLSIRKWIASFIYQFRVR